MFVLSNEASCLAISFSTADSTNYLHIAGRPPNNAADYINATMLAVSVVCSVQFPHIGICIVCTSTVLSHLAVLYFITLSYSSLLICQLSANYPGSGRRSYNYLVPHCHGNRHFSAY